MWVRVAAAVWVTTATTLAVLGALAVYCYMPADKPIMATAVLAALAAAWCVIVLRAAALRKATPGAALALSWLAVLFVGMAMVVGSIWPEDHMADWEAAGLGALLVVAWVFVLRKRMSYAAMANVAYSLLWLLGTVFTVAALMNWMPESCVFGNGDRLGLLAPRLMVLGAWALLVATRVPWRYPWGLIILLAWPLGTVGVVVASIGAAKLGIEIAGRRNVLARSRLHAGAPVVPVAPPRGLVECVPNETHT